MSTTPAIAIRELDHRSNDGIDVWPLWSSHTNRVWVAVKDERLGESLELEVDAADALAAFHQRLRLRQPRPHRSGARRMNATTRRTFMGYLGYHASLARRGDLPRQAAEWRRGNDVNLRPDALPSSSGQESWTRHRAKCARWAEDPDTFVLVAGIGSLAVNAASTNHGSRRFYERHGFRTAEVLFVGATHDPNDPHSLDSPLRAIEGSLTLRFAGGRDTAALARLAELDRTPVDPVLLAGVRGDLHAARSLPDRAVVADPCRPAAELFELLPPRPARLNRTRTTGRSARLCARLQLGFSPAPSCGS